MRVSQLETPQKGTRPLQSGPPRADKRAMKPAKLILGLVFLSQQALPAPSNQMEIKRITQPGHKAAQRVIFASPLISGSVASSRDDGHADHILLRKGNVTVYLAKTREGNFLRLDTKNGLYTTTALYRQDGKKMKKIAASWRPAKSYFLAQAETAGSTSLFPTAPLNMAPGGGSLSSFSLPSVTGGSSVPKLFEASPNIQPVSFAESVCSNKLAARTKSEIASVLQSQLDKDTIDKIFDKSCNSLPLEDLEKMKQDVQSRLLYNEQGKQTIKDTRFVKCMNSSPTTRTLLWAYDAELAKMKLGKGGLIRCEEPAKPVKCSDKSNSSVYGDCSDGYLTAISRYDSGSDAITFYKKPPVSVAFRPEYRKQPDWGQAFTHEIFHELGLNDEQLTQLDQALAPCLAGTHSPTLTNGEISQIAWSGIPTLDILSTPAGDPSALKGFPSVGGSGSDDPWGRSPGRPNDGILSARDDAQIRLALQDIKLTPIDLPDIPMPNIAKIEAGADAVLATASDNPSSTGTSSATTVVTGSSFSSLAQDFTSMVGSMVAAVAPAVTALDSAAVSPINSAFAANSGGTVSPAGSGSFAPRQNPSPSAAVAQTATSNSGQPGAVNPNPTYYPSIQTVSYAKPVDAPSAGGNGDSSPLATLPKNANPAAGGPNDGTPSGPSRSIASTGGILAAARASQSPEEAALEKNTPGLEMRNAILAATDGSPASYKNFIQMAKKPEGQAWLAENDYKVLIWTGPNQWTCVGECNKPGVTTIKDFRDHIALGPGTTPAG